MRRYTRKIIHDDTGTSVSIGIWHTQHVRKLVEGLDTKALGSGERDVRKQSSTSVGYAELGIASRMMMIRKMKILPLNIP